jgi:predicted translation initiation factor SUI1
MTKKKIDVSEREISSGQSLGDLLSNAGLHVSKDAGSKEESIRPVAPVKQKQKEPLHLRIEKKARQGKVVTIVSGFTGLTGVIEDLAKVLKAQCGVGGSVKDREIVLQGDLRNKVGALLVQQGYKVK